MGEPTAHGGDAILYSLDESFFVRTTHSGELGAFEVERGDAVVLPVGSQYEVLNFGNSTSALLGVAPSLRA